MLHDIQKAFDRAASTYENAAALQHQVGLSLIQHLPDSYYARMLDLGCGTGLTTHRLATLMKHEQIIAQDFSFAALNLASIQHSTPTLTWVQADFNQTLCGDAVNLIFSNMALHWSDDLFDLLMRCRAALVEQGVLAFSIPLSTTFHELRTHVHVRAFETEDSLRSLLAGAGFALECYSNFKAVYPYKTLLHALRAIKQTGATVVQEAKVHHLKKFALQEPITLTYDIGLFIARKRC